MNAYIRAEGVCARQEGMLTPAWEKCIQGPFYAKYVPAMNEMNKVVTRAAVQVQLFEPCHIALSGYMQSIVYARVAGAYQLSKAQTPRFYSRSEIQQARRRFVLRRNQSTKARLRVNARCAP